MKLAIMQPYFFPYIGYFQLINAVDKFIIFDIVQYINKGWMNRNRILSQNLEKEWEYISVPIQNTDKRKIISSVKINNTHDWRKKILGKMSYYKKIRAPYYDKTVKILKEIIYREYNTLVDFNVISLGIICEYLGIAFKYEIASQKDYDYSLVNAKDEWALQIAIQEKAQVYFNPIGGIEFFNRAKYLSNNIKIFFLKTGDVYYKQSRRDFVSDLSIIDIMMFNDPEKINELLSTYILK